MSAFRSTFSATTPRFFKVIVDETSSIKLKIPPKFVKKYGDYLSKSVRLKLPSGCQWEVEVTESDSEAWFEKGWQEFFKFYSLDSGHFLLFTYQGNSMFEVCIFDRTATETEYPIIIDDSYVEDDNSIEILNDFTPCSKTRDKSPSPSARPSRRKRTLGPTSEAKMKGKEDDFSRKKDGGGSSKALERAKAFKSENPSIMIAMQPHYIHNYTLNIPLRFIMSFTKHGRQFLKLQVGDRFWSACLNLSEIHRTAKINHGWHVFVKENHLSVGDVCIFELMKVNDLVLKVHMFRG
ncbi:putative transcription factor B3-Domain family [Rosa chinensis]|uniref:Putative transcription factor B3-Domain family n=1 Tax=Rosa chinensis TaxID=74649 RepID=A0A2P6RN23_ROSCH|nr:B3 domain-containing transcription factor VRN1 [Rosa chinensis]PRQ47791.1 putative transcription factor B3-Domain family [Rosa chinensis]